MLGLGDTLLGKFSLALTGILLLTSVAQCARGAHGCAGGGELRGRARARAPVAAAQQDALRRRGGQLWYLHCACSPRLLHYCMHVLEA